MNIPDVLVGLIFVNYFPISCSSSLPDCCCIPILEILPSDSNPSDNVDDNDPNTKQIQNNSNI